MIEPSNNNSGCRECFGRRVGFAPQPRTAKRRLESGFACIVDAAIAVVSDKSPLPVEGEHFRVKHDAAVAVAAKRTPTSKALFVLVNLGSFPHNDLQWSQLWTIITKGVKYIIPLEIMRRIENRKPSGKAE